MFEPRLDANMSDFPGDTEGWNVTILKNGSSWTRRMEEIEDAVDPTVAQMLKGELHQAKQKYSCLTEAILNGEIEGEDLEISLEDTKSEYARKLIELEYIQKELENGREVDYQNDIDVSDSVLAEENPEKLGRIISGGKTALDTKDWIAGLLRLSEEGGEMVDDYNQLKEGLLSQDNFMGDVYDSLDWSRNKFGTGLNGQNELGYVEFDQEGNIREYGLNSFR